MKLYDYLIDDFDLKKIPKKEKNKKIIKTVLEWMDEKRDIAEKYPIDLKQRHNINDERYIVKLMKMFSTNYLHYSDSVFGSLCFYLNENNENFICRDMLKIEFRRNPIDGYLVIYEIDFYDRINNNNTFWDKRYFEFYPNPKSPNFSNEYFHFLYYIIEMYSKMNIEDSYKNSNNFNRLRERINNRMKFWSEIKLGRMKYELDDDFEEYIKGGYEKESEFDIRKLFLKIHRKNYSLFNRIILYFKKGDDTWNLVKKI